MLSFESVGEGGCELAGVDAAGEDGCDEAESLLVLVLAMSDKIGLVCLRPRGENVAERSGRDMPRREVYARASWTGRWRCGRGAGEWTRV